MTQHDQDNLAFLLAQTPEGLKQWYDQADGDDIEYAAEILRTALQSSKIPQFPAPSTLQ